MRCIGRWWGASRTGRWWVAPEPPKGDKLEKDGGRCGESGGVRTARADGGSGGCEPHGLIMGGMGMVGIVGGVGAVGGVKKEKLCQSLGTLTKFIY